MEYYYKDHYSDFTTGDETTVMIVLLIFSIIMFFALAIGLVLYLLKAFGIYKMAKTLGVKNAGLAFVPIVGDYILGKVAETPVNGKKSVRFSLILLLLNIASFVLGFAFSFYTVVMDIIYEVGAANTVPNGMTGTGLAGYMVGYLATLCVSIAFTVFYYMALYRIFKIFTPDYTVAFLLLSIFISGAVNILLFIIRNKPAQFNAQGQLTPPVGTPGYNPAYDERNYNPYGYNQSNYTPNGDWNYRQSSASTEAPEATAKEKEESTTAPEDVPSADTESAPENNNSENA